MIYLLKKKISKKIKEFKRYSKSIRFYEDHRPVIYVNLNHRTKVRTYLNIFFRIKENYDAPIVIKFSLLRMIFLAKWFNELNYIYFEKPFSRLNKIKTFSHNKKADFVVNYNYKKVYSSDNYIKNALPYIMHPSNYLDCKNEVLTKKVGIIMSGNFDKKIYNTNTIRANFGMHNRWEIYKEISTFDKLLNLTGDQFISELESGVLKDKFILMQWKQGAIPALKWRYYLSSAYFIFCAPGMTMPLCHNVLEAMSVGVIPILNYPHWLNPSLKDEFNCLVYHNLSDIKLVIEKALSLNDVSKQVMMKNVLDYYKKYYENYVFEEKALIVLNENLNDLV